MRRKTRERIDGAAMLIIAVASPIGVWAQAGADTDVGSIVGVSAAVIVSTFTSVRLWLQPNPRSQHAIELPVIR